MARKSFLYVIISNIYKTLLSRAFISGFVIILEVVSVFVFFTYLSTYSALFGALHLIISIAALFNLLNKNTHPSYKLSWAIIVLLFPFAGGFAYLIFANKRIPKKLRNIQHSEITKKDKDNFASIILEKELNLYNPGLLKMFINLRNSTYFNFYKNTKTKYYPSGKDMFEDAIKDLKKAENFIFLEYYIVARGYLFDEIFEVLKDRIESGVDVFLIYDDFGSIATVDLKLVKSLEDIGVDVTAFNPMRLGSVAKLNYRTHRKIIVVDNKVAYTGGVNMADEYVDKKVRFGKWKDTAARIEGEAVRNFTLMFVQNYYGSNNIDYVEGETAIDNYRVESDEYVFPFSVSPSDNYSVARNIHLDLLSIARKSFHIHTPYLIIDYDMTDALINAARSGVEVIITVPAIPDKISVNYVTKCNYKKLVENGVKIYEYTPGFLHSKSCTVDGEILLMSGINMDFRSYFLNYETGVLIANSNSAKEAEEDFVKTLEECEEITLEKIKKMSLIQRFLGHLFSVFAPLI